ncbi:GNAT family N-acetyltransferase [Desulfosporosinus lacus]|uniref:Acetyltransferase (GNAT) domain-containing protein n=1 Tax=Desulfosporosinus lacus DSM 15449 TaxID=1121420 RepID=A0A1M6H1C2_9FIRM|nr:GNAT family N-acetyltransferase [Desulfosporosinus lacus]SHJ15925.1 Acetyltransferase (GNAT) domain-containing protein [Desulfosporosinus lacus DSM 15449]
MEYININGKEYQLAIGYGKSNELRKSLNDLTQKIFGFDFEQWYQDGYWKNQYIPYSLLDGDKIVSNVSVNIMNFRVYGEEKRYIQLGTVMTNADYREQGLSRVLTEKAIGDYRDKCDLIYLFANNSVLNFYPKFGFKELKQYQCVKKADSIHTYADVSVKKLNMSDENNRRFVIDKVMHAVPISIVSMCTNAELIMFYCTSFMKHNVYYLENYDAVVIADFTENTMEVMDVFCTESISLNRILKPLSNESVKKIVLFFTPQDTFSYETILLEGEDTLFAMGKDLQFIKSNQFMFPKLSHT